MAAHRAAATRATDRMFFIFLTFLFFKMLLSDIKKINFTRSCSPHAAWQPPGAGIECKDNTIILASGHGRRQEIKKFNIFTVNRPSKTNFCFFYVRFLSYLC